jgi:hypothetical protein
VAEGPLLKVEVTGMLGTNATRSADLNFLAQLVMAASLTLGMFLVLQAKPG